MHEIAIVGCASTPAVFSIIRITVNDRAWKKFVFVTSAKDCGYSADQAYSANAVGVALEAAMSLVVSAAGLVLFRQISLVLLFLFSAAYRQWVLVILCLICFVLTKKKRGFTRLFRENKKTILFFFVNRVFGQKNGIRAR